MARRKVVAPVVPSSSLVASAVRYTGKVDTIFRGQREWQKEAWRHYDICPELRFGAGWIANALSRVKLYAANVDANGAVTANEKPAATAILNALFGGPEGQSEMLHSLGLHLTVAGEAYIVGRQEQGQDIWEVVGINEITAAGGRWSIRYGEQAQTIDLQDSDVVIRIWRPHPARRIEADSAVRALLPILMEIEYLTRHIFAQTTSRLAGSGILFLPLGMSFPPPPEIEGQAPPANDADAFMRVLGTAMTTPLADPGDPSSVVPIVVQVPDDVTDKPHLMHFWSEFDAQAIHGRQDAIHRLALGMDIPPEVILGMTRSSGSGGSTTGTGANHWTAWQIEESAIKLHIEPLAGIIVNSIVMAYIRVVSQDKTATIGVDTQALKLQPDRSKEAMELYDRGEVKGDTLRSANGFNPTDNPDDPERKLFLLRKIAGGSATPEQVQAALEELGVHLATAPPADQQGVTREARPNPSLLPLPVRPGPPGDSQAALLTGSEALVFRALERAGNRMRQGITKPPGVPAAETYLYMKANGNASALLADAWTCVAQVMDGVADPVKVTEVLDAYCHTLLSEQSPHTRERLARFLDLVETT